MLKLDKNFVALDLELNNGPNNSTPNPKIIQVGIAIGNIAQDPKEYLTVKWYLDPEEKIFPNIVELTGITDEDIRSYAVSHKAVADELSELLQAKDVMKNCIVWGGGDADCLVDEFNDRSLNFNSFSRRSIDVSNIYMYLLLAAKKSPFAGLKSAMAEFKINFVGTAHRADVDAFNTLAFFFSLVRRQTELESFLNIAKNIKR